MELLLLADPSEELLKEYLKTSACYVAEVDGVVVGEYLLMTKNEVLAEIINVAVDPKYQNRGIGKKLVLHAINQARKRGFNRVEIGIATIGHKQIKLYEDCGFRKK